ncbi:MerR family transcriptional regulator [Lysinibacillus xylanilyticus]|uniref:MerR family transcriptional regulator n=1 Tax=Lysinibacillus xylanilyticus TaxID=582475 RepID=UPI003D07CD48
MQNDFNNETGFMISDLVSELNISARSIRYYEELGLLSPKRTAGNHRVYSKRDRARLKMIIRAKSLGFSLDEIIALFELYDMDRSEKSQYEEGIKLTYQHLEKIRTKISELKKIEDALLQALQEAETEYKNRYED